MALRDDVDHVEAPDAATWRAWLEENHATAPSVWLVYWKRATGRPSVTWSEAVDEALCFGWIDTTVRSLGPERHQQYFTPRSPTGTWSRINKAKIERLLADGLMHPAGLRAVETAKANGSWDALTDADGHVLPDDLAVALAAEPGAQATFDAYTPWVRSRTIYRVTSAKRPATRAGRIEAVVAAAARGERPPGL